MLKSKTFLRVPLLIIWAVLLSAFTAVLGATPLRSLRLLLGNSLFWLVGVILVSLFTHFNIYPMALLLAAHVILVGAYSEFEDRGLGLKQSALFAIFSASVSLLSIFYVWTSVVGKGWYSQILAAVTGLLDKFSSLNFQAFGSIKAQDIVNQLPSILLIFLMVSMALALVFERATARWVGANLNRTEGLSDFSAPGLIVWFFIFSLLGAFGDFGVKSLEVVSINILNVTAVIYFFQGAAVLGKYLTVFKIGPVWKFMWIFLFVVQLPIVLSAIGLVDYWLDVRRVFIKRAAKINEKKIQDN